jgi:ribonuclease Z
MTKQRKLWLALAALLAALAIAAYLARVPLALTVAQRVAVQRMAADPVAQLPDGLHLGLCGAGSPFPDEQRAGPCTLVVAGPHLLVFDAGSGAARGIARMGFNIGKVEGVFLTHFHSDHLDGLGELLLQRWVGASNTQPVPLYGPPGVEQVAAGFMQAYRLDQGYRVAHHGAATVPPSGFGATATAFTPPANGAVVVLKNGELEVSAFAVDHTPVHPAVGYRVSYKGRSLVISGDTKKSAAVQQQAANVDLLVHEALSPQLVGLLGEAAGQANRSNLKKIMADIVDYHTTPEQAAQLAQDAHVGYLLLNHIAPPLPLPGMTDAFLGDAPAIFHGPLRVGRDGDFISLPANSKDITLSHRF